MSTVSDIQKIYIAFFNRPADAQGVEYWTGRIEAGVSLPAIASSFVDSPEFKALYAGSTNAEVITSVYRNLFGRDPDLEGLQYWEGVLDRGQIDAGMLAYEVLRGAGPVDRVIIDNKSNAAVAFTNELPAGSGMYGGKALGEAREWLRTIDDKPLTAAEIKKQVDKMFGGTAPDPVEDVSPPPVAHTFSLGWNGTYDPDFRNLVRIDDFNAHEDGIRIVPRSNATFNEPDIVHFTSLGQIAEPDALLWAVFRAQYDRGDGQTLKGNETVVFSFRDVSNVEQTYIFVDDGIGLGANGPGSASYNVDSDLLIHITGYEKLDIVGNRVENLFLYD
jgi:hypothetical protein